MSGAWVDGGGVCTDCDRKIDTMLFDDRFQDQTRQCRRQVRGSKKMVNIPCQMINCFCMFSDYIPLTLDEWIEVDRKRRAAIQKSDYENRIEWDIEEVSQE